MNIEKVKNLDAQDRFLYWIKERESIRIKKEAGEEKPWSNDEILQRYKFCNVRRMDDRVSRWLMKNWYEPNYDHPNMLVACTLARQLNNTDSLDEVGFPSVWRPKNAKRVLQGRVQQGLRNFSAAYMITGTLGGTKIEQVVDKVVTPIAKAVKLGKLKTPTTLESLAESLQPFAGFSTFIAGQVSADARWAVLSSWEDKGTWAPVGPGSRRGINRLLGREPISSMNQADFLVEFKFVLSLVESNLPEIYGRLEAIDVQNCLCEFWKYERNLFFGKRLKQRYDGI